MRAMGRYRKDSPSRRPPSKPGQPPADDTALWEQVTKSVTELPSRRNTVFLKEEARTVADPAATAEKAAKKGACASVHRAPEEAEERHEDDLLEFCFGPDSQTPRRPDEEARLHAAPRVQWGCWLFGGERCTDDASDAPLRGG